MRQMAYQGLDALRHSPLTPPVTIIIPAWNEQDVIVNLVRSALQADYPDLQVIVVDDGSTDATPQIVSQFKQCRAIRQDHLGLSAARNAGIGLVVAVGNTQPLPESDSLFDIKLGTLAALLPLL